MKRTILIADDESRIRAEFGRWLIELDAEWKIVEARDHDEAFEAASRERPDLVLLDAMMPCEGEGDHVESIRRLRGLDVPILLITGGGRAVDRSGPRFQAKGLDDLGDAQLEKPVRKERLQEKVRELLERRGGTA